MGKNNRARRAAKAKKRANNHRQSGSSSTGWTDSSSRGLNDGEPLFDERKMAEYQLVVAAQSIATRADPARSFATLGTLRSSVVAAEAEQLLARHVRYAWDGGWQPVELLRQGRRDTGSAAAGRLVALAIATDNACRRATTLDSQWMAQIERLDLPPVDGRGGWVSRWVNTEGLEWPQAVRTIVDALRSLIYSPRLEILIPPPGSNTKGSTRQTTRRADDSVGSDPVLEKIRNLLAKAESTDFEAEATAFTAKAQELMTRHAIDAASIERGPAGSDEEPIMIRVMIDSPYVDAKALLLHVVAEANRCRSISLGGVDMSSVVGFEGDVAAVEMLFTSLLVQAQSALADAARRAPAGTRVRSQAYRSSFLAAFAYRIGDRLAEINAHVFTEAEAEVGSGFQLVLRDRSATVDAAFDDWFSEVTKRGVRGGYDPAGSAGGAAAADQAQLGFGDLGNAGNGSDIDLTDSLDLTGGADQQALPLDA